MVTVKRTPKPDASPRKVSNWWNTWRHNHVVTVDSGRERAISILQSRYGYNREEAIYQLEKYYSKAWLG